MRRGIDDENDLISISQVAAISEPTNVTEPTANLQRANLKSPTRSVFLVLLMTGFLFLSAGLLAAGSKSVAGLEESIYMGTPGLYFLSYFAATCIGFAALLYPERSPPNGLPRVAALILLAIASSSFLLLPVIRGYFFYGRGDILTHWGITNNLRTTGLAIGENFYPLVHILLFSLWQSTAIPVRELFMLSPPLFQMAFATFGALTARRVAPGLGALVFAIGLLPILGANHILATPSYLSYILVLIAVYLIVRKIERQSTAISLCLVVLLVALPIAHPLTAVFVVLYLAIILGVHVIARVRAMSGGKYGIFSERLGASFAISAAAWIAWMVSSSIWAGNVRRVSRWLAGELSTQSVLASTLGTGALYNMHLPDLIFLFIKMYGTELLLTVAVWTISVAMLRLRDRLTPIQRLQLLTSWLLGLVVAGIATLNLSSLAIADEFRPLVIAAVFGFGLLGIIKWVPRAKTRLAVIAGLLLFIGGWGPFAVYSSPFTLTPNQMVTPAELSAAAWIENALMKGDTIFCNLGCHRLFEANGLIGAKQYFDFLPIPDHFNLTDTLGDSPLILVLDYDRLVYTGVWSFTNRFNAADFVRTMNNSNLSVVYTNGKDQVMLR